jgi:hypothetical protein
VCGPPEVLCDHFDANLTASLSNEEVLAYRSQRKVNYHDRWAHPSYGYPFSVWNRSVCRGTSPSAPVPAASITCTEPFFNPAASVATNPSPTNPSITLPLSCPPANSAVHPFVRTLFGSAKIRSIWKASTADSTEPPSSSSSAPRAQSTPAAGLAHVANQRGIRTIYIGPEEPANASSFDEIILGSATQALPPLLEG